MATPQLAPADALHTVDFYLGDPYATYRRLRREAPVSWYPLPEQGPEAGMWLLAKWEDIRLVSKRPRSFSTASGVLMNDRLGSGTQRATYVPKAETIIHMDPPKHGRVRNLVSAVFTPRRVAELEPFMRELCREQFDSLPRDEPIDLVTEIAAPVPAITVAQILGVPRERWRHFQDCANAMIEVAAGDPEDGEVVARHGPKLGELAAYLQGSIEAKKRDPGDDLLSALVHVEVDGATFDDDDVFMMAMTLLGAGNETTRTLVSGACWALSQHPDQLERLLGDPGLVPGAVEEFLRWVTPVHSHARTALEDFDLRGQTIRKGDYVLMLYASANRDEEVWEDPDRFDLTRPIDANPHLSLGHGEHFCLGAHLARLEARVVFEEFLARFPRFAIQGEPRRLRSTHINGIESMPVILDPK